MLTLPNYIVSGFPRSGTSMMMRALAAGGLEAAYDNTRNEMARRSSDEDYQPNPDNELYELADFQYREFGFPLKYAGKVIKAVTMHARNLDVNPAGTKVVFMHRDPEEIRQSYMAFFQKQRPPSIEEITNQVAWTLRQMKDRKSFDVCEVNYRDVVKDPIFRFECLELLGWPIDPVKAAAEVKSNLLRYKLEDLTIGIL